MKEIKQINEILNNFDFKKVNQAMKLLNWKWFYKESEDKIPTITQLKKEAKNLLKQVIDCSEYSVCSTGGFVARKEFGYLLLEFVLEDWDTNEN